MLTELLKAISEQAVRASGIQTVTPPIGSKDEYGIRKEDGSVEWFDANPDPRQHKVSDVASLVTFAEQMQSLKAETDGGCILWYSRSGAVLIVDDLTRRDRVTLSLETSPQLKALARLDGDGIKLEQAGLVRLLRVSLAGCWEAVQPNLAMNASKIKFKRTEDGHSEIVSGKTSLGKSLQAEMSGAGPIPEVVVFAVPVFAGHPWKADVSCDLQVIADEGKFALTPLAGEIEKAFRLGETALAVEITQEIGERELALPLYYGTP